MNNYLRYIIVSIFLIAKTLFASENCASCQKIIFKENKNQWHQNVKFKAELKNGALFLEKNSFTYLIQSTNDLKRFAEAHHAKIKLDEKKGENILHYHVIKTEFVNANASPNIEHEEMIDEYFNYFLNNDKSKWASKVRAYKKIIYQNLYNQIDLSVSSSEGNPKYDFILKKGADANDINIKYEGAASLKIKDGNLLIGTSVGDITEWKPIAFQIINGKKESVNCLYKLNKNILQFEFPNGYNRDYELVIDPTLIFSTYSGSFADNFGYTATYDSKGNAFAAGSVFHFQTQMYPTTAGAFQTFWAGGIGYQIPSHPSGTGTDIGITKYDSSGTNRIFSTYLGGIYDELPHSIVVNSRDELIVFGTTGSNNFPVTANAYDTSYNGGTDPGTFTGLAVHYATGSDIIVTHFTADGTALVGSTYVGGSNNDGLNYPTALYLNYNYADEVRGEIDLDENDNVIIATCTNSQDFPTTNLAYRNNYAGGNMDACVFKLNNTQSQLIWSTYLGGSLDDAAYSIAFDRQKNIYISGGTRSFDFPVTTGVKQPTFKGGRCDGFIAHLDQYGQNLLHSTYYGSPNYDQIYFVETNKQSEVYVLGQTDVQDSTYIFNSIYNQPNSGQFISKLKPTLDSVLWSNIWGRGLGRPDISPTAFLVDVCNKIYVAGWGSDFSSFGGVALGTTGLNISPNAYQTSTDGNDFYLMVMEDGASLLNYATYFGSPNAEEHVDGGTSRFDKKGICYQSVCAGCGGFSTFPTYPANVVSTTNNSYNCNNAVFKFDMDLPFIAADFEAPPSGCSPVLVNLINKSKTFPTTTFYWSFGDGTFSTQQNPSKIYTQSGLYTIQLVVFDPQSCNLRDTIEKQILVLSRSKDTLPDKIVCAGGSVQIGIPPLNDTAIHYNWTPSSTLSDSNISNPIASPNNTTTYQLLASNGICIDSFYQKVIVFENAFAIVKDTALCPNDSVHMQLINVENINGLTISWRPKPLIYYGDSSLSVTVHSPTDTSFYVNIQGGPGCAILNPLPYIVLHDTIIHANFSVPITGCVPFNINVTDSSLVLPTTQYSWNFGDGFTSTQHNPSHTYNSAGTYTIKLVLSDNNFCPQKDSFQKTITILDHHLDTLPDKLICKGGNTVIGINPLGTSITYNWSPTAGLSNAAISNPTASPANSTNYTLFVSNGICIDTFQQKVIVFNDKIHLFHDSFPCPKDTIQLYVTNTLSQSLSYQWLPAALIQSGQNTAMASALPNSDTIFSVVVSNGVCVFIDSTKVSVVKNKSVKADFLQPPSGCYPLTVQLQNTSTFSSTAVNYFWDLGNGNTSTAQNPSVTYNSAGVYTVKLVVKDTNAYCQPMDSITKQFTVFDNGTLQVLPNDTICKGGSKTLATNIFIDSSYTLSWSPNLYLNNNTILHPTSSPDSSITYLLNAEKNNCVFYFQERVIINTDSIWLASDTAVCPGDTLHLNVQHISNIPLQYSWKPFSLIVQNGNTNTPTITTNQDTTFTVAGTNYFGCVYHDTIRIHALLENVLKADFNIPPSNCAPFNMSVVNNSIYLPSTQFLWTFGDGSSSTQVQPNHVYTNAGLYTVKLVIKDSLSCNGIDSIEKKIYLLDHKKDSLPDKITCSTQSVTLGLSNLPNDNSLHFQWIPGKYLNDSTIADPICLPQGNITYQLIVRNNFCSDTFTQRVIILSDLFTINQDSATCPQDTFHVSAIASINLPNINYQWLPNQYIVSGANSAQATVRVPIDTYLFVNITVSGCSFVDSIPVFVKDEEQAKADFATPPIGCAPYTATFINKSYHHGNPKYTWNFGDGSPLNYANSPTHTYDSTGTYTITLIVTDSAFLCKETDTVQYNISIQNNNQTDTLPEKYLCKGSSVKIGLNTLDTLSIYSWHPGSYLDNASLPMPTSTTPNSQWYKLSVNLNNCIHYYWQHVRVIEDSVWITKRDNSCESVVVIMNAHQQDSINNPLVYHWEPAADILNGQGLNEVTLKPSQPTQVILTATDTFGCVYHDTAWAVVYGSSNGIEATATPIRIKYGDTSQLNITGTNIVNYSWRYDITLSDSSILNPKAFPLDSHIYYAKVYDEFGCEQTDTALVIVERTPCPNAVFFLPNAFSPNNDGHNDVLYVRGYNIEEVYLAIYDRWGQKVFETSDMNHGWNGYYNGAKLDPSVFAYYLEGVCAGGEHFLKKGNVTLLR